jgi:hypothetical protein
MDTDCIPRLDGFIHRFASLLPALSHLKKLPASAEPGGYPCATKIVVDGSTLKTS